MHLHHAPINPTLTWNLHVWQLSWDGSQVWDPRGVRADSWVNVDFPQVTDPRLLQFKFRSFNTASVPTWESDAFVRQIVDPTSTDVWTFEQSPRIITRDPSVADRVFDAGDLLTVRAITKSRFSGGSIYVWNPYDPTAPTATFAETARDEANGVSTFALRLLGWMTRGFHFKLTARDGHGDPVWESDSSNRVWRPPDGDNLWIKSGQCDARSQPLALTPVDLEILIPSAMANAPVLTLRDLAEGLELQFTSDQLTPYAPSPLLQVASYRPTIYPQATYTIRVADKTYEAPSIVRPFPADPANVGQVSRFSLGASAWQTRFPQLTPAHLEIQPLLQSSFGAGLSVQSFLGNSTVPYQTSPASQRADNIWSAPLSLMDATTTCVRLAPVGTAEPKPYDWIDIGRYLTPATPGATYHTTEGVFGITTLGPTTFADPPISRAALMQEVFGAATVGAGIFASNELPQGAVIVGTDTYFVLHAPHAVCVTLVLVDEGTPGNATRQQLPMTLTDDTRYWWCKVAAPKAVAGTRYRFILNDDIEVLDPAARDVLDTGSFDTQFQSDPNDATTAWSRVLDVAPIHAAAHSRPWRTMGWEQLLIYEMHAGRFTDTPAGNLPFARLVAALGPGGYLQSLPVTALELLPVQEFSSSISWGYDPSFYFAIDGHYGSSAGLAAFVSKAHGSGRAVILDVVYNHSLGSSLMKIASDVYSNGQYYGDRMNCGHPMVREFLRQATIYLWRTFGLDGFRFDDTKTIVTQCEGGWEFLAAIRWALRAAADAEGKPWAYCVAENFATSPWDVSDPGFGVMDGNWDIDEVFRIRDASYDMWQLSQDDAGPLQREMNEPDEPNRPFYQAVRFGESHDAVSEQDSGNKRIAARPPFGLGLQLAKAMGTLTLLSNGVPMIFMGQEGGETIPFAFDSSAPSLNPQNYLLRVGANSNVLNWFRSVMGLRNDPTQGLQGESNYQTVTTGHRTIAFGCGADKGVFVVVTFGTANQRQDSAWLGLPAGLTYKEILNSSWPVFQVSSEQEQTNGGYNALITAGRVLNLPYVGAVILQRI
jgi:1,4-alpha-glucan branching enzyme